MLRTFLAVLDLERVYLASQSVGWPVALHFALQHPECLEGLVLIGAHDVEMDTVRGAMPIQTRLPELTVPTLVLLEAQGHATFGATASAQGLPARSPRLRRRRGDSLTSPRSPRLRRRRGRSLTRPLPYAEILAERLPHCTKIVVSDATLTPSAGVPALQLGHAMVRFLLHCERQRNLVRGASFLL